MNIDIMIFLIGLVPLVGIVIGYVFIIGREQDKHLDEVIKKILDDDKKLRIKLGLHNSKSVEGKN